MQNFRLQFGKMSSFVLWILVLQFFNFSVFVSGDDHKCVIRYKTKLIFENLVTKTENYGGRFYRFIEHIGHGGGGEVYSAVVKPANEQMVAIKIGRSSKLMGDLTIQKLLERRFTKRHKYLDKSAMLSFGLPQSIYSERRSVNATMIFPRYGISLNEILDKARCNETIPFSDATVYKFLDKMYGIFGELHSMRIVHNDVKPRNVMVGLATNEESFEKIVLIDLGGATDMDESDASVRYMTAKYARVETLLFKLPAYQNDLYGLMVSALEIAGHEPHWFKIHSKPKSTYRRRLIEALQKKTIEEEIASFERKGQNGRRKRLDGLLSEIWEDSKSAEPPYTHIRKKIQQKLKDSGSSYGWETYFRKRIHQQMFEDSRRLKKLISDEHLWPNRLNSQSITGYQFLKRRKKYDKSRSRPATES